MRKRNAVLVIAALLAAPSCIFDSGARWQDAPDTPPPPPICTVSAIRCDLGVLERCDPGASPGTAVWTPMEDCTKQGMVCVSQMQQCKHCYPNEGTCEGQQASVCDKDGNTSTVVLTCEPSKHNVCRAGSCVDLCVLANTQRSNVGCEYW